MEVHCGFISGFGLFRWDDSYRRVLTFGSSKENMALTFNL